MKIAHIHKFGGPDNVVIDIADAPSPGPQHVSVRVEAASVNPVDVKMIAGYMQHIFPVEFPYAPGTDFSGVVQNVGTEVSYLKAGDRVFRRCPPTEGGVFGQQVTVAASDVCAMPDSMSFEQAAALPTAFGTARQALFDVGHLKAGERVLIHAGVGGIGSFAIQLARRAGAHVIATASVANLELIRGLGAHEAIDYRAQGFSHLSGIDLVIDAIGGATLEQSWSTLGPKGRIATLVEFGIKPRNGHHGEFLFFKHPGAALPEAVSLFGDQLQIVIDSTFALDETRLALEKVATGHARGKVLVRPNH